MSDYFYVPCEWLRAVGRDPCLPDRARDLAIIVAQNVDHAEGVAYLSHAFLAAVLDTSEKAVVKARSDLVGRGYLGYRPAAGRATRYWLTVPDARLHRKIDPKAFYCAFPQGGA